MFPGVAMDAMTDRLTTMFEPVTEGLGFELVGVEYHPGRGEGLLRIYIDHADGITVDDCARISHQVSGVLDVEDPISGRYRLEVSSPGLDRPLMRRDDFERFAGHEIRLKLTGLWEGRRKLRGILRGLDGETVILEEEGQNLRVPLDRIEKGNLVPDL